MDESKKSFFRKYLSRVADVFHPAFRSFKTTEKTVFFALFAVLAVSFFSILSGINRHFLVEVPALGGALEEGVASIPRFINPLLAVSEADKDMTTLIHSGLLRTSEKGDLIFDLAEKYEVSEDGKEYFVTLKEGVYFHDGKPVTADDVIFTVRKAQDSAIKSPKRANWEGVFAEKISDREIKFVLKNAYAPFLINFTMGILPKHIWEFIDPEQFPYSQFNMEPVGSGPYKIKTIKRNSSGLLIYYELEPFSRFILGRPNINKIILRFYGSEKSMIEAYKDGYIKSMSSLSPSEAEKLKSEKTQIVKAPMSRVYAVFFNQNQNAVLANKEVRSALDVFIDRQNLVSSVLLGYGQPAYGPIPPGLYEGLGEGKESISATSTEARIASAKNILLKAGWKENGEGVMEKKIKKSSQILSFSLYTSDISPDLVRAAKILKETWEKIGAKVDLKIYNANDLSSLVIRPRKFEALLFGEVVGRDLDMFAFWHSSQRNDPGYNIVMYANSFVDKLLDEARKTQDETARVEKYKKFEEEIAKDIPAVFLYSPDFIYMIPKEIKGISIREITTPQERFSGIYKWYTETDRVWKYFAK